MGSDWLIRAAIAAEGFSFFLVVPEIVGIRRVRRVERAMERWLAAELKKGEPLQDEPSALTLMDAEPRPGFVSYASIWLASLAAGIVVALALATVLVKPTAEVVIPAASSVVVFLFLVSLAFVGASIRRNPNLDPRMRGVILLATAPSMWLDHWGMRATLGSVYLALRVLAGFLSGPRRIRMTIFWAGVVLFIVAIAIQAATV